MPWKVQRLLQGVGILVCSFWRRMSKDRQKAAEPCLTSSDCVLSMLRVSCSSAPVWHLACFHRNVMVAEGSSLKNRDGFVLSDN